MYVCIKIMGLDRSGRFLWLLKIGSYRTQNCTIKTPRFRSATTQAAAGIRVKARDVTALSSMCVS
jgi:hypothetical protein